MCPSRIICFAWNELAEKDKTHKGVTTLMEEEVEDKVLNISSLVLPV
jgi:hypothetical protein